MHLICGNLALWCVIKWVICCYNCWMLIWDEFSWIKGKLFFEIMSWNKNFGWKEKTNKKMLKMKWITKRSKYLLMEFSRNKNPFQRQRQRFFKRNKRIIKSFWKLVIIVRNESIPINTFPFLIFFPTTFIKALLLREA